MAADMYYERLVLADGTILPNCSCGYSDRTIWCFLKDISFGDAFVLFSDPTKNNTIVCERGTDLVVNRITYSGIAEIKGIEKRDFTVDVCLEGDIDIHEEMITQPEEGE